MNGESGEPAAESPIPATSSQMPPRAGNGPPLPVTSPAYATTTALLESLHDAKQSTQQAHVWEEFDARYRPILIGFAMKLGLGHQDAADVAQQALTEFVRDYRAGQYERGKGRLSSWLISIARNRAVDVQRAQGRRRDWRGESAIDQAPLQDSNGDDAYWQLERKQVILARALSALREGSRMSEHTIKAFELVALRGVPAAAAAQQCGMSVDEVYVAKNRVTKQLREIVSEMTRAYDEE